MIQTHVKDISEHSKYQHFWILTHQGLFTEQPKAAVCGWFETFGITYVNYNTVFDSHICLLNQRGGGGEGGIK